MVADRTAGYRMACHQTVCFRDMVAISTSIQEKGKKTQWEEQIEVRRGD